MYFQNYLWYISRTIFDVFQEFTCSALRCIHGWIFVIWCISRIHFFRSLIYSRMSSCYLMYFQNSICSSIWYNSRYFLLFCCFSRTISEVSQDIVSLSLWCILGCVLCSKLFPEFIQCISECFLFSLTHSHMSVLSWYISRSGFLWYPMYFRMCLSFRCIFRTCFCCYLIYFKMFLYILMYFQNLFPFS